MQLLVARLVLRKPQRFLAAERENAEHHQAVVEERVNAILEVAIEVDENVSTEDDREFGKRSVGHEVVLREHGIARERRAEQRSIVFRRVVLGKGSLAAR